MSFLKPVFQIWNKSFKNSRTTQAFAKKLSLFLSELKGFLNSESSELSAFAFDDSFVWFRNLGFLKDSAFNSAASEYSNDPVVMSKIWRIWIISSLLASISQKDGDIVDIGTYDGKSFLIALRYALLKKNSVVNKNFSVLLYDAFENPPDEARKSNHGKELFDNVCNLFQEYSFVLPVKGYVPESCIGTQSKQIKWAQIDLNSAEYDCKAFLYVLPRLTEGAIVVFDDYGFARYKSTQESLNRIVDYHNLNPIIELPTGQGLYIHHQ